MLSTIYESYVSNVFLRYIGSTNVLYLERMLSSFNKLRNTKCLRIIRGWKSLNIFFSVESGRGKTALTRNIFDVEKTWANQNKDNLSHIWGKITKKLFYCVCDKKFHLFWNKTNKFLHSVNFHEMTLECYFIEPYLHWIIVTASHDTLPHVLNFCLMIAQYFSIRRDWGQFDKLRSKTRWSTRLSSYHRRFARV